MLLFIFSIVFKLLNIRFYYLKIIYVINMKGYKFFIKKNDFYLSSRYNNDFNI